jgi:hypothetical protein
MAVMVAKKHQTSGTISAYTRGCAQKRKTLRRAVTRTLPPVGPPAPLRRSPVLVTPGSLGNTPGHATN